MRPIGQIAVMGLGYVGLPLAVQLARHFDVVGFDISAKRVEELRAGHDRTDEITRSDLEATKLKVTDQVADIRGSDIFIITVPTPVDAFGKPDLTAVRGASRTVAGALKAGATIVLESTVYPGVTEEICGPVIEEHSGLKQGKDFFLGYSPERINPGDREHTVDRITKVVSGQTVETAERLGAMYGAINGNRIFIAKSIKTAEAAKVIENAQRDINIAFINEVTQIFHRAGLSVYDVLDASRTKWNFLPFTPGLVGGHCIGVDPFYLSDLAQRLGHHPEVILAGRRINDAMGEYIADQIATQFGSKKAKPRALVLGLAFKENVPDLRNSKVVDVVKGLERRGFQVDVHDSLVDADEAKEEYGIEPLAALPTNQRYDVLVGAVAHDEYKNLTPAAIASLVSEDGLVADIKGMWRTYVIPTTAQRWHF
jgi:UDP-N-acetyl-D-glucosamine/UDP-N-acetyl-D-galactosamine dehydrogenase